MVALSFKEPSATSVSLGALLVELSSLEASSISSISVGSSTVLEKSNRWASLQDNHWGLEEFLTSSKSLGFLGRLVEVVFSPFAILSFLVGLLGEEVNPPEK